MDWLIIARGTFPFEMHGFFFFFFLMNVYQAVVITFSVSYFYISVSEGCSVSFIKSMYNVENVQFHSLSVGCRRRNEQ